MNGWERFCRRHKGSISIFLSIILLPMLWLIGVLVDSSNYNLSKVSVEGAGEMAVNAALANYDTVLADVYGLFAISQSTDELAENLEGYFKNTLEASGLMESGIELDSNAGQELAQLLQSALGREDADELNRNFVKVEYKNFAASGLTDSDLSNPEILKSQIVEFMKYRGPAEVGMSLLDALGLFKKTSQQSKVVQKQMKVEEATASLAESAKKFYEALEHVDVLIEEFDTAKKGYYEGGGAEQVKNRLGNADTICGQLENVVDTSSLPEVKEKEEEDEDGETTYSYSISKKKPAGSRRDYQEWLEELADEADMSHGTLSDGIEELGSKEGAALAEPVKDYIAYLKLLENVYWLQGKVDDESLAQEALEKAYSIQENGYGNAVARYESWVEDLYEGVGRDVEDAYWIVHDYRRKATNLLEAKEVKPNLFEKMFLFEDNALDDAMKKGEKVMEAMKAVQDANDKLKTAVNTYEQNGTADDFSAQVKSKVETNEKTFREEDVQLILDQLNAIKSYVSNEKSRLEDGCKLYGEKLLDIDVSKGYVETGKKVSEKHDGFSGSPAYVVLSTPQRTSKENFVKPIGQREETLDDGTTVTTPPYYTYMKSNYSGDGTAKKDKNLTTSTEVVNEAAKNTTGKDSDDSSSKGSAVTSSTVFQNAPSGASGGEVETDDFSLGEGNTAILGELATILKLAGNLVSDTANFAEDGRDNLLVTQYVDSNFSSAVTDKRKKADDASEGEKDPKTMTNVAINTGNNPLYGCEMEYILYGNKGDQAKKFFFITLEDAPGPEINVSYAKNNILSIRLACNSVFAISNRKINNLTYPPAMAIQVATGGIFPYKVAQVVLDVCLAFAESVRDVQRLMDGEKVELVKTWDSWVMRPETLIQTATNEVAALTEDAIKNTVSQAQEAVTNKVQELIDDTATALNDKSEELSESLKEEATTTIDSAAESAKATLSQLFNDTLTGMVTEGFQKEADFAWKKADLQNRLTSATDSYLDSFGDSGFGELAKILRDKMVERLVSNSEELLQKMNDSRVEGVKDVAKTIEDAVSSAVDTASEAAKTKVEALSGQLNEKLQGAVSAAQEKLKETAEDKIEEISEELSQQLSSTLNAELNEILPQNNQGIQVNGTDATKNSSMADNFKFSYQDYLRIFLFLELSGDKSDAVMRRIADVIQVNLSTGMKDYGKEKLGRDGNTAAHGKGADFRMNKAYTYVQLSAQITLDPLLLSQQLFQFRDQEDLGRWSYQFQTVKGY